MKVNILTGSLELGKSLRRYLRYVLGIKFDSIRLLLFGPGSGLSREILDADFWIAEAFNPFEPDNPEGFRTLNKLTGKKGLLLFLLPPDNFPEDGPFWCTIPCSNFREKIERAMSDGVLSKEGFQRLVEIWPDLGSDPSRHGHRG